MNFNKLFLFIFLISLLVLSGCSNLVDRRIQVLDDLNSAIEEVKKEGKYRCCIEPACTMCYLGDWLWEGECYCDDMIAKGEYDKVCPQCKKGIEEGICKSSIECEEKK